MCDFVCESGVKWKRILLLLLLQIHRDRLTLRYVGNGCHANDFGSAIANRCVPSKCAVYYYEVHISTNNNNSNNNNNNENNDTNMHIVTVGFGGADFSLNREPGSEAGSYGFQGR